MNLQHTLNQSAWKFRAWLVNLEPEELAGWKEDEGECPISNWLEAELGTFILTSRERIACLLRRDDRALQYSKTPPVLARFIDLVDQQPVAWVSREQALDYLDQAERQFAQRCTYPGCTIEASTDECAGFLVNAADGELHRQNCWPFVGRLCLAHMRQVVVPPDWWISETALSPAGFGSDLEKVGAGGDD